MYTAAARKAIKASAVRAMRSRRAASLTVRGFFAVTIRADERARP